MKMHTFTKHYIDNMLFKAIECKNVVCLKKITDEDIENYKSGNKFNILQDNNLSEDNEVPKDNTTPKNNSTPRENTTLKDNNTISKKVSTSKSEEPPKKKQKVDTTEVDVLKLVLSREDETEKFKSQFKSSLKSNNKLASTSINETNKEIDSEKSAESSNSSANIVTKIWVIDHKKIVDEKKYALFLKVFSDLKFKNPTNTVIKSVPSLKSSSIFVKDIQMIKNSKFKDPPVDLSTVQQLNNTMPATKTIKKPANLDGTIQHWVLAKNPDGTLKQRPLINTKKTQTTGNTTVQSLSIPKPPLHNFYESFSSSLQNTVSSESSIPKAVPTKKCIVVKPANTNTHFMQVATSSSETGTGTPTNMTLKSAVQNNKSSAISPLQRAEGSTFLVGNKQYQLIKGSAGQMGAVMNGSNILVKSLPPTIIKCYAKDCNNPATIVCSSCTTVMYCSHNCQQRDWYDNHINNCERLLNKRQKRS